MMMTVYIDEINNFVKWCDNYLYLNVNAEVTLNL